MNPLSEKPWNKYVGSRHLDRLDPLDDRRGRHSMTDAHDLKAERGVAALELVQEFGHQHRSRCSKWVTVGDGTAIGIYFRKIGVKRLSPRQHDSGKRLVDFHDVDIL